MTKYIGTKFTGVRYREHPTRRHGPHPDKYFIIRYKIGGKAKQEALGWASQGWSAAKAHKLRCDLVANIKLGQGSQTLEESRQEKAAEREAQKTLNRPGTIILSSTPRKIRKAGSMMSPDSKCICCLFLEKFTWIILLLPISKI